MPDQSLPLVGGGGKSRKRAKPSSKVAKISTVAHDIDAKARTEDVISEDNRNKEFSSLMLSEPVLNGLKEAGFVRPSPIQMAAIPSGKIGLDMIVQSKSGTGKTCVYVVTALEMIKSNLPGLQVLVIAPTREIALQGVEVASQIGSRMPDVKISSFIGGMPVDEDRVKAAHCHLAVGTPGRLKQIFTENILNPDTIRLVILDEADKLLEPSFLADTTHILNLLPQNKQVLALSATYPDELANLAEKFMRSPQHIRLGKESQVLHGVAQYVLQLEQSPSQQKQNQIKQSALLKILSSVPYNQCLIFSNYQVIAQASADFLNARGFPAIFISAGQDQLRRIQAIQTFKQFKCRILCSTDLTARGIDAENVNLVVNLDVPTDHNTYLHRIGRGGRFGSKSIAISLAPEGKELKRLQNIVNQTNSVIRILPEILPKNIGAEELPVLPGASAEEVEENPGKESGDVTEESSDITEENSKTEENPAEPRSGKIKRRGKKKTAGQPPRKENEEKVTKNKEVDHVQMLQQILSRTPQNLKEISSFEQLEEIAKNLESSTLISGSNVNQTENCDNLNLVGNHFFELSEKLNREFESRLGEVEKQLGYRTVPAIIDAIKSNSASEIVSQTEKTVESSDSESTEASSSDSYSSDDEESSVSMNPKQTSVTGQHERIHSDGNPKGSKVIKNPPTAAAPAFSSATPASSRGGCVGLPAGRAEDLRQWMRQVTQQRQLIQEREYWRVVNHYSRRN